MSGSITVLANGDTILSVSSIYASATLDAGGTLEVSGSGVDVKLSGITAAADAIFLVENGATLDINNFAGAAVADSFAIGPNGTLEIGSGISTNLLSAVTFDNGTPGSTATLNIDPGLNVDLLDGISNFGTGDSINLTGQTVESVSYAQNEFLGNPVQGGVLTIVTNTGTEELSLNTGTYATGNFTISGDDISFGVACFAAGTQIDTQARPVPVENLREGDLVLLASGTVRPVKWIGWRDIVVERHADPDMVRPIRIQAHAIAEGMPRRDLLVSPDHALFIDGKLIPARLLRNGMTIYEEYGVGSVTYYHVELDAHDVLLAEGLPAESYLDTGNRASFVNAGLPVLLHADFGGVGGQARREAESCMPLVCDAVEVEPVWEAIARRAEAQGFALPITTATDDPALYIVTGEMEIAPVSRVGARYTFVVPAVAGEVRLSSRSTKPSTVRPWVEDRRSLGVMVREVIVRSDADHVVLAMDDPRLANGWWASEHDSAAIWRWTDGNAALPIEAGSAIVEVVLGETQSYPVTRNDQRGIELRKCA